MLISGVRDFSIHEAKKSSPAQLFVMLTVLHHINKVTITNTHIISC